ncbi:MAG TPA: cation:proton antiporter [Pyrinomonadaceae bacterium]|nr:cation:proton antiporter [Pyrinomonadaceae bacterium]
MPESLPLLQDILLLLLASVPIAFIFNRLRLPTIVGFIITGVVIGPYGLALIDEPEAIEALAQIGVMLLLFTIGIEFSLRQILEMKRLVLLGGGLQVGLTTLVVAAIAVGFNREIGSAVFLGCIFAISGTAIFLKSYIERGELDAPHGRVAVGISLFQDLSTLPMMLMIPILGGSGTVSPSRVITTLAVAIVAIVVIIFAARSVVPYLLYHIVRLRSPEVFIISVVLLSLGTSWVTAQFGLSLALGAFIAGLVLSESEYSHQIVADILPFRDVFNSVFFISVGMLLSVSSLRADIPVIVLSIVGVLLGKALIILLILRLLGYSLRVSVMTALALAQIGEFSFILARAALPEGLLSQTDYQRFLAVSIVSMISTPFLIRAAPRIGYALQSRLAPGSLLEPTVLGYEPQKQDLRGHVVIVGYGLNGRNLAKVLRRTGVSHLVLELNAESVRQGRELGERIVYGDATRKEVLHFVGLEHARVLVLAISDPGATRHTVRLAREINPAIHIIVRTRYMSEVPVLSKLGANDVIPEEFETSIEIFSRVLREFGIARHVIQQQVATIRSEGYEMLRMPSISMLDMSTIAEAFESASTETLIVESDSPSVGKTIGQLQLRTKTGVSIIALIHDDKTEINPGPETLIQAGDVVVLLGSPEKIDQAIQAFLARRDVSVEI